MKENLFNEISLEYLIAEAEKFQIERESDSISYQEFLKYFNELNEITKHNLIIAIYFTYGWMPTIFDFKTKEIEKNIDLAIIILNKAKNGIDLKNEDYELLKKLFNNSLVGSSKLLHFINPEKYPIWDSRVYRFLNKKEPYDNRIGKVQNYIEYKKLLDRLTKNKKFEDFLIIVTSKLEYKPTNLRALEIIMFTKGKK